MIEALLVGLMTGFVAALFGVGGGVLAIPVMVFLLHVPPAKAVGTNSVIIIASTTLSAFFHWRQGTLRREGLLLGAGGVLGTFVGNELFFAVAAQGLMKKVLGIFFILIGLLMLTSPRRGKGEASPLKLFLVGIGIGTFAALVGMSGGILLNPVLVAFLGYDIKDAIGTSVAALPIITVSSAIPKVLGGYADLALASAFIPGIIIGTMFGAKVMKRSKSATLKKAFALFMIAVGVKFLL